MRKERGDRETHLETTIHHHTALTKTQGKKPGRHNTHKKLEIGTFRGERVGYEIRHTFVRQTAVQRTEQEKQ